jgi:hypothetical protein
MEGNQQDENDFEKRGIDAVEEEITDGESRWWVLLQRELDLAEDRVAEAGVTGVLKTLLEIGDMEGMTQEEDKEEDAVTVEETIVDLPT